MIRQLRVVLGYAARRRPFLALLLALIFAGSLTAALQPWPIKLLVDHVLEQRPAPPWLPTDPTTLLVVIVLGGLVLFALNIALDAAAALAWTVSGRRMVYALAEDLFARLQRRSILYHHRHSAGDMLNRVTGDSWALYQVADALLYSPARSLLTSVIMIYLMARIDASLALLVTVTAPLMLAGSMLAGKSLRAASVRRRDVETRLQAHVQQILRGLPVVQAFVQEERERSRFERFADEAVRSQQKLTLLGGINALSSGLITILGAGAVLWLGARHYLAGTLSIGGILAFLAYLNLLQAQMKIFANIYTTLQGLGARIDRAAEVLNQPEDLKSGPALLTDAKGAILFEHVSFGYDPARPVLQDINSTVHPGQVLAIVGPSGTGKTTLANLVPRFFDPWTGRVLIDGRDARELDLGNLRSQVAIVPQDSFLFPVSVSENIALGRPNASREEIEAAARAANAHAFISALPHGYETVVGDYGATLSGGEKQRIAIARALIKNAPILILDEPTSALDAQSEQQVMEAISRLMQGRTTLLIAHRPSTIRHADQMIVLEGGRA